MSEGFDSSDCEDYTTDAHERRITRCRTCRARIIFLAGHNSSDKKIPVDADTVEPDDYRYEQGRHERHFCPPRSVK